MQSPIRGASEAWIQKSIRFLALLPMIIIPKKYFEHMSMENALRVEIESVADQHGFFYN